MSRSQFRSAAKLCAGNYQNLQIFAIATFPHKHYR